MEVHPVPSGFAVSSAFEDSSGDRISFYIAETPDGYQIEDGGDYLANLVARDIHIESGMRGELLEAILREGGAFWDRDTFEIRTDSFDRSKLAPRAIAFLSALIRVRDLALLSRERVRSAFREDFLRAAVERFGSTVFIRESIAPANDLAEFPADVVLRPLASGRAAGIYLVNSNDKLNEALLARRELDDQPHLDVGIVALLEEPDFKNISRRRFQRAQNRGLAMPIFRGDEGSALDFIARQMKVAGSVGQPG